jgi:hypothetical protein
VVSTLLGIPLTTLHNIHDLVGELVGKNHLEWTEEFKKFLLKRSCWENNECFKSILDTLDIVQVRARLGSFYARKFFTKNWGMSSEGQIRHEVQIRHCDERVFEELKPEQKYCESSDLRVCELRESAGYVKIIAEIGGVEQSIIEPWELAALLLKQASGEDGALLNHGGENIFFIEGNEFYCCAWAVICKWSEMADQEEDEYGNLIFGPNGWDIRMNLISGFTKYGKGTRIFYRNPT